METKKCKFCGSDGGEFGLLEIVGYDWDSDDDAALSIQRVLGYRCAHVTACAERVVEQSADVEALRMVAGDYENLGDLALQAREALRELAAMTRQEAISADLVAREAGWGGIGL